MISKTRIRKMIAEISKLKEIVQENDIKIKILETENINLKNMIEKISKEK